MFADEESERVNGRIVAGRIEETKIVEREGETAVVGEGRVYWREKRREKERERLREHGPGGARE